MAGAFRQLPTVIKRGSRAQTVAASLKEPYLWKHFEVFELQENMTYENTKTLNQVRRCNVGGQGIFSRFQFTTFLRVTFFNDNKLHALHVFFHM